ncbi:hypothetical protein GCM10027343_24630 [Noviherbaspirillum agri]
MRHLFVSLFVLALVPGLLPRLALAFDVTPTVSVIELPAKRSGITLSVNNPRKVDLPVTFEIFERFINEDGTERHEPADDAFMVFPPQAVIAPQSSQAIRVQWLDAPPETSRSFTLYAVEIPVDLSGANESKVHTVLRMGASVHVAATGTRAEPVLAAATAVDNGVRVSLSNSGKRFYYVDNVTLEFPDQRLTGMELANAAGRTLIPPGATRTFDLTGVQGAPRLITQ